MWLQSERARLLESLREGQLRCGAQQVLLSTANAESKASARLQAEWTAEAAQLETQFVRDSVALAEDCDALQREEERVARLEAENRHLQDTAAWATQQAAMNKEAIERIVAQSQLARQLKKQQHTLASLTRKIDSLKATEAATVREAEAAESELRHNAALHRVATQVRQLRQQQQGLAATLDVLREDHEEELARLAAATQAARAVCADAAALHSMARLCKSLEVNSFASTFFFASLTCIIFRPTGTPQ